MLVIKKMFKSKRGDDMLIDFWSIAVFAVILLLFFLLFSVSKSINDNKVQAEFVNKDVNFMLESFLRAPAIGIGVDSKTVGEIITEDSTIGDFSRTEKLFNNFFKNVNQINDEQIKEITLTIKGSHNKEMDIGSVAKTGTANGLHAETYIPGYTDKVYVKLYVWSVPK